MCVCERGRDSVCVCVRETEARIAIMHAPSARAPANKVVPEVLSTKECSEVYRSRQAVVRVQNIGQPYNPFLEKY